MSAVTPTDDCAISIVIGTYNGADELSRTLQGLFQQDFDRRRFEIVIVVDGSTDNTRAMLANLKPPCTMRVIEQPNGGPSAARNTGIRAARGNLILILDDDVGVPKDLVSAHVRAHSDGSPKVVFGPVMAPADGAPTFSELNRAAWAVQYYDRKPGVQDEVDLVVPNSSAPRAVLLAHPYDEEVRVGQDRELAMQLMAAGVPFVFLPEAVVTHAYHKPGSAAVRAAEAFGRGQLHMTRKHPAYRPKSRLAAIVNARGLRGWGWQIAVRGPISGEIVLRAADAMLKPFSFLASARRVGARLFGLRMEIVGARAACRAAGGWRQLQSELGASVAVLMYHRIGPAAETGDSELTITPQKFRSQMQWLVRIGYTSISADDWLRWLQTGKGLPDQPVLITFDDAYADIVDYALPVLDEFALRATLFVVTGRIGQANSWGTAESFGRYKIMSAEQIRSWVQGGREVGSHTRTHPDLTTTAQLDEEIAGSRTDLESLLGCQVRTFAYPFGRLDAASRAKVAENYDIAFSAVNRRNDLLTDRYALRRTYVRPGDTLWDFQFRVRYGWNPLDAVRRRLLGKS